MAALSSGDAAEATKSAASATKADMVRNEGREAVMGFGSSI